MEPGGAAFGHPPPAVRAQEPRRRERAKVTLIDQLRAEHALVEQVAGSLRTFARSRLHGAAAAGDGLGFLRFFRIYAGSYHHAREEDLLFVALERELELPGDRGPLAALRADHLEMAGMLDRMEASLGDAPTARAAFATAAVEYSGRLWRHIDAENSVLLPEAAARLARLGPAFELPTPEPDDEQLGARAEGERLAAAHPPQAEPDVMRGDGCIACPAYGGSCEGLEREWWNEWEWEEFEDHLSSG